MSKLGAPPVDALLGIHERLTRLDPEGPAEAAQLCGPDLGGVRRLVALAGSFNPPHVAHFTLLRAALAAAEADGGALALSVRTVDKERVSGMMLEDRIWLVCQLLERLRDAGGARLGAVATNRGLYVDQATALRELCPQLEALIFVIGYDKIEQVLDARYYEDRGAALRALFAQARFLVAPRDEHTLRDLVALLAVPENQPYTARIAPLPVEPSIAFVSSTSARQAIAGHRPLDETVPRLVQRFLAATGCYAAPDGEGAYGQRRAALARLVAGAQDSGE